MNCDLSIHLKFKVDLNQMWEPWSLINFIFTFPLWMPFYFLFLACIISRTASSIRNAVWWFHMTINLKYTNLYKNLDPTFQPQEVSYLGRIFINVFHFLHHDIVSLFVLMQFNWYDKYVFIFSLAKIFRN